VKKIGITCSTKIFAEIIVFSALSGILYTIRPFSLPYGGTVTLGSMIPVMWLSMRRGIRVGVISGLIFGFLALFIDMLLVGAANIIVSPVQVFLEYPVAFGVLGFAGIFRRKSIGFVVLGAGIGVILRFLLHYLVGVYIWASVYEFPAEWGLYLWPAVYNGSFLIVEFIINAILLPLLVDRGTLEYQL
jgi:thiamine transporter